MPNHPNGWLSRGPFLWSRQGHSGPSPQLAYQYTYIYLLRPGLYLFLSTSISIWGSPTNYTNSASYIINKIQENLNAKEPCRWLAARERERETGHVCWVQILSHQTTPLKARKESFFFVRSQYSFIVPATSRNEQATPHLSESKALYISSPRLHPFRTNLSCSSHPLGRSHACTEVHRYKCTKL